MAISADSPAGEIARGRGGFYRSSDGKPYIVDPSGDLVKSGARKGMPKRLVYGSPSGAGKLIENTYNLQKWGNAWSPSASAPTSRSSPTATPLTQLERDTKSSAKLPTASPCSRRTPHSRCSPPIAAPTHTPYPEDQDEERDWILRAEAGRCSASTVRCRHRSSKRGATASSARARDARRRGPCVDDAWRLAGTLDRIARCTKALRFALITGEIVEIPAGTVLVLDVKSGRRRTRPTAPSSTGQAYAVQIASYAQSVPYDTETEQRGEWPWPIDQTHALIAHLDVLGAIDGKPSCELVYVDLVVCANTAVPPSSRPRPGSRDATCSASPSSPPGAVRAACERLWLGHARRGPPAPNVTTAVDSATGTLHPRRRRPRSGRRVDDGAAGVHDDVTPAPPGPTHPNEGDTVDQAAVDALSARQRRCPTPSAKAGSPTSPTKPPRASTDTAAASFQLGGKTGMHSVRRFEITAGSSPSPSTAGRRAGRRRRRCAPSSPRSSATPPAAHLAHRPGRRPTRRHRSGHVRTTVRHVRHHHGDRIDLTRRASRPRVRPRRTRGVTHPPGAPTQGGHQMAQAADTGAQGSPFVKFNSIGDTSSVRSLQPAAVQAPAAGLRLEEADGEGRRQAGVRRGDGTPCPAPLRGPVPPKLASTTSSRCRKAALQRARVEVGPGHRGPQGPAQNGFKAGQPCSGDVYTITLVGYSAETRNPAAAEKAGFTVVDGRIVLRTEEEREKFILHQTRTNAGKTSAAKDFEVTIRRPEHADKAYEQAADALFLAKAVGEAAGHRRGRRPEDVTTDEEPF